MARMTSISRTVSNYPADACKSMSSATRLECMGEFNFAETKYKGAGLKAFRAWWPKRYVLGDECWRRSLYPVDDLINLEYDMPDLHTQEVADARQFFQKNHFAVLRKVLSADAAARIYAYHNELIDER
eukprot:360127-Amphidinium_carterae.1